MTLEKRGLNCQRFNIDKNDEMDDRPRPRKIISSIRGTYLLY